MIIESKECEELEIWLNDYLETLKWHLGNQKDMQSALKRRIAKVEDFCNRLRSEKNER